MAGGGTEQPGASRRRVPGWAGAAVLLPPLLAMALAPGADWGSEDIAAAALLLVGAGLGLELAARRVRGRGPRAVAALAVLGGALLVWAELAVGLLR